MKNNGCFFEDINEGMDDRIGYNNIGFHMVFYVRFTFHRKTHCIAGNHHTDPPVIMTYDSVVC